MSIGRSPSNRVEYAVSKGSPHQHRFLRSNVLHAASHVSVHLQTKLTGLIQEADSSQGHSLRPLAYPPFHPGYEMTVAQRQRQIPDFPHQNTPSVNQLPSFVSLRLPEPLFPYEGETGPNFQIRLADYCRRQLESYISEGKRNFVSLDEKAVAHRRWIQSVIQLGGLMGRG